MKQEKLNEILRKHALFLEGDLEGKRADMCGADLHGADLRGVNLRRADMCEANLHWADLRGADLDYSCWPLRRGSLDVKVDKRIAAQLAYHFCRLDCDDPEYLAARNSLIDFANQFHRADEYGRLMRMETVKDENQTD